MDWLFFRSGVNCLSPFVFWLFIAQPFNVNSDNNPFKVHSDNNARNFYKNKNVSTANKIIDAIKEFWSEHNFKQFETSTRQQITDRKQSSTHDHVI